MAIKKSVTNKNKNTSRIVIFLMVVLTGILLFTQQDDFKESLKIIKNSDLRLFGLSIVFALSSYVAASLVYKAIAVKKLSYSKTLLVQFATGFTNRLLPAGAGGLATFGKYLVSQGHSNDQATALLSVNNLLGFIGLMILTFVVALVSHTPLNKAIRLGMPSWVYVLVLTFTVIALLALLFNKHLRKSVLKFILSTKRDLRKIAARPLRLLLGLFFSMLITLSYAAVLYVAIHAMGASASVLQTFIVLTIGVAAASVTPTPGGIGGAEAGLVAGLSSIGISADLGLSIALAYRFSTFWLPILPGFVAFQITLNRKII